MIIFIVCGIYMKLLKQFNLYSPEAFLNSGLKTGTNVMVSDDVIFHNAKNIIIGNNVRIDTQCIFVAGKDTTIFIGDNCHINTGCVFHGSSANIIIENNVEIADKTVFYTSTYDYTIIKNNENVRVNGNINIKPYVIIGCSSIIMPNVTLSLATTVGVNSFVKNSSNEYDVIAGVPAKFIKKRKIL